MDSDRRDFLKNTVALAAGTVLPPAVEAGGKVKLDADAVLPPKPEGFNIGYAAGIETQLKVGDLQALKPEHVANYKSLVQKAGKTSGRVQVLLAKRNEDVAPLVNIVNEKGNTYIIINDAAHDWTPAYVNEKLNISNADIQAALDKKALVQASLPPTVLETYQAHANKLKLPKIPKLYLNQIDQNTIPSALCQQTREGDVIILMNPAFVKNFSEREQNAVLAHELTHVAKGHLEPQHLANVHNDRTGKRYLAGEIEADAGSRRLTCDDSLKPVLRKGAAGNTKEEINSNDGNALSFAQGGESNSLRPTTLPSFATRIEAYNALKNDPGCVR